VLISMCSLLCAHSYENSNEHSNEHIVISTYRVGGELG